ncbi:helix-turn-helix domain-containing protein [Paenibacillus sp. NPDC057967]|uniref:helix-turn-helix domain-containing protein n=1 Tax=Paenibacillus sp. NPDC057967 TaxID=3346293 RepID=UPI0036DD8D53
MERVILQEVGLRLRYIRKSSGLTQDQLAEKAGVHSTYIGSIERAEKNITLLNLQKIAQALNVEVADLFTYSKRKLNDDKEKSIDHIFLKIQTMKSSDLRKVELFINEFF